MRLRALLLFVTAILMTIPLLSSSSFAEETSNFVPNKLLCAKMIRYGQEAYTRGRFQDAKDFFRKAVTYDPNSKKAWLFYDQAVLFALAERVERKENRDLLLPGNPKIPPQGQHSSLPAVEEDLHVTPEPAEADFEEEEEEEEEEGC